MTLAATKTVLLLQLLMCFRCYGNLKFLFTYDGKVKSVLYCYLTVDILSKVLKKYSLSSPLPNILFLCKPLNLIGCYDNRKAKFAKKIISSEAIMGIKLKLCRNVHDINLYTFFAVARVLSLI